MSDTTNCTTIFPDHISSLYRYERRHVLTWGKLREMDLADSPKIALIGPSLADTSDDAPVFSTIGDPERLEEVRSSHHYAETLAETPKLELDENGRLYRFEHRVACKMVDGARYGFGSFDTMLEAIQRKDVVLAAMKDRPNDPMRAVYLRG